MTVESLSSSGGSLMEEHLSNQIRGGGSIPTSPLQLVFKPIDWRTAIEAIIIYHYLHRRTPISWSFGAYFNDEMYGVCTIGKPASHTLIEGVCGKEHSKRVFELNRFWMDDRAPKNSESRFIGWVLRQLPQGIILVSYADTAYGHTGTIYRATNWIYTGQSIPFTDYTRDGLDHRSIPKLQRDKSKLYKIRRSRKNRYVYFVDDNDQHLLKWPRLVFNI